MSESTETPSGPPLEDDLEAECDRLEERVAELEDRNSRLVAELEPQELVADSAERIAEWFAAP